MDPSISRPAGLQGSPRASPRRGDATDSGPIPDGAEEGPRRSRTGVARFPVWSRGRIGLLLLALIVLPWLPTCGTSTDLAPARRVRGVGDPTILTFAFAPDGATIATIQTDGRVALQGVAGGGAAHAFLDHRGFALALAFAPDGRSLAVGGLESDILRYDVRSGGAVHPPGPPLPGVKGPALSPPGPTLGASTFLPPQNLLSA